MFVLRKISSVAPPWLTWLRRHYWGTEWEEQSPIPDRNWTHELKSFALQACASTTTAHLVWIAGRLIFVTVVSKCKILKCFLLLNRPWRAIADVWTSDSLRQVCKETLERPIIRSKFSIADELFFPSAELLPEKSIVDDGRCQRRSLLIEEPSKKIKPVSSKRRRYFWPMVLATEWRHHGCVVNGKMLDFLLYSTSVWVILGETLFS